MGLMEWMLSEFTCSEAISQTSSGHAEHSGMGTRRLRVTFWTGDGIGLSPDPKLIVSMCGRRGNFPSNSGFASLQRGR